MRPALVGALALLAGCPPADDTGVDCETAPLVTWETFGRGFLTQHCQSCHATTAPDRHDAPSDVSFDTLADVIALQDQILAVATGPFPFMPPKGGVTDDDRERLAIWLECWGADGGLPP